MSINIIKQIEIIKRMVNEKCRVYVGDGYITDFQCKFYEPAAIAEINQMEEEFGIIIPSDYKEFLLIANGMYFMNMVQFYSLSDIEAIIQAGVYKKGVYPIAYNNGDTIIINSDDIICGQYLYAGGHDSVNEFVPLFANFTTFLDRLISVNGRIYWDWYDHKIFYNFGVEYPTSTVHHFINHKYTEVDLITPSDD